VKITSSAIEKLKLFAAMQSLEVWRHDGQQPEMFRLIDGAYQTIVSSQELLGLATEKMMSFLNRRFEVGESSLIREFRQSID